ncbi:segregation and condensation protein A [Geothermobacter hydrogeniphilus]|uniref:Segregation and condensation protein A n=1 Tax=Geothermobacter hydrogeniphilus TaxID=1969733 RepID=A0A1X0YDT1_9BACT|nr:segregation/condensation protein A [Geothermobacter hydrogeniphilus]ORJ63296.1 segregation/condensation protein A [Geothermobacter hydrogeniphilus]
MNLDIKLENFEGPLDLLLHLIKKNEMEIWDIQVTRITEQYLAILDAMHHMNLDVAGEFLVMASTLLYIKSKLLLPPSEDELVEEEEEDPRAELVRRLLEYQKYKDAALDLDERELLGRDVFARKFTAPELAVEEEDAGFYEVGIYDLVEALQDILARAPRDVAHEVGLEQVSIAERINHILGLLSGCDSLAFSDLFQEKPRRNDVIATFLAMLELVKMRTVKLMQNDRCGSIWLFPIADAEPLNGSLPEEDSLGYH